MKWYIAYKFSGENFEELSKTLKEIAGTLEVNEHEVYYASQDEELFVEKKFNMKQILEYSLERLDKSNCILVFVKSNEKSEGMLLEIGYALAKKKKIILAIKKGAVLHFTEEIADNVIRFENLEELKEKLREL